MASERLDWRIVRLQNLNLTTPNPTGSLKIKLPFTVNVLEVQPVNYPLSVRAGVDYKTTEKDSVPWDGFYAPYKKAKIAVTNVYGVWFELELQQNKFTAIRVAREQLHLQNDVMAGVDIESLFLTSLPVPESRPPTRPPSRGEGPSDVPVDVHSTPDEPVYHEAFESSLKRFMKG